MRLPNVLALGGEFYRWEVATATAGRLLSVNPFDEPNVQQAKDATKLLLDGYLETETLPTLPVDGAIDGTTFTLSRPSRDRANDPRRFLESAGDGDYLSIMAFLPPEDEELGAALEALRHHLGVHTRRATMFGYGPRYLHSTGQLHKGGANNGLFIIITAPPRADFPVPDAGYSFGTLETAQAIGDFQSLETTGRRALLVQLSTRSPQAISALAVSLI
jgi:hypothetical protein